MAPEGWEKGVDWEYRHHDGPTASVGHHKRMGGPPSTTKLPEIIAYAHDPDGFAGHGDMVRHMDKYERSKDGYIAYYVPGHRNTRSSHTIPVAFGRTKEDLREAMEAFMRTWPHQDDLPDAFRDLWYTDETDRRQDINLYFWFLEKLPDKTDQYYLDEEEMIDFLDSI